MTLVAVAFLRQAGIPAPVVLVVAGLVIGFLPFVPDVSLEPDVVLLGLLPLLVFDAAVTSSPTGFYRDARSIGALALLLVVATAFAVAAVAHWVGHLAWPISFVLGTAVGPTDAAATAVARRVGLPRRLLTILDGEALFNDATALVLYAAAVTAATTGQFSVAHTNGSIAYSVVVGTGIGLAVGIAGRWLRNRVDDPPIEIAGSILLAYVAYLPAEEAHAVRGIGRGHHWSLPGLAQQQWGVFGPQPFGAAVVDDGTTVSTFTLPGLSFQQDAGGVETIKTLLRDIRAALTDRVSPAPEAVWLGLTGMPRDPRRRAQVCGAAAETLGVASTAVCSDLLAAYVGAVGLRPGGVVARAAAQSPWPQVRGANWLRSGTTAPS